MVWTGVITFSSLLLGLDRDLFGLSGHHKSSQGLPALQQFIFYSAKWSLLHAHFLSIWDTICMIIFMHKLFRIHRWQKLALAFGLLCLEGIIIFQHQGIDKNFFFLLPFVTVYFVNACLRSSFLKSYDLQYLKQMSIALYFSHPIFIEWARYGFSSLPLTYPDRGKLIFVTALFGSHLFGLAMLWVRDKKKNQKNFTNLG